MDLAKIRKKSLTVITEPSGDVPAAPVSLFESTKHRLEPASEVKRPAAEDFLPKDVYIRPVVPVTAVSPFEAVFEAERNGPVRSPLETILAGRSAAGCDDEAIIAEDGAKESVAESSLEFLCFRVSDEIYGINIMDIKEIIKPREVTEVPRAPAFVSGVLSLRGTIIPVIDMRLRLGLAQEEPDGKCRIIVIKNADSFSGLLVDEVIQVVRVQLDSVEATPAVLDGIDRDFVSGLGRSDGKLMIILNLENIADINLS